MRLSAFTQQTAVRTCLIRIRFYGQGSDLVAFQDDASQETSLTTNTSDAETSVSTDNSVSVTPIESGTPTTRVVIVPGRDRSGTVITRHMLDAETTPVAQTHAEEQNAQQDGSTTQAGQGSSSMANQLLQSRSMA